MHIALYYNNALATKAKENIIIYLYNVEHEDIIDKWNTKVHQMTLKWQIRSFFLFIFFFNLLSLHGDSGGAYVCDRTYIHTFSFLFNLTIADKYGSLSYESVWIPAEPKRSKEKYECSQQWWEKEKPEEKR